MNTEYLNRARLLLGDAAMERLSAVRVILFGVGGVGSWCAEALVRTGVEHLTIVDSDCVAASNVNRQLPATSLTVGRPKVEVLRERLLEINPEAEITALQKMFCTETADDFALGDYDFVMDAIDSLRDKALLINRTCATPAVLLSSMGAAQKLDPTRIRTAEFRKVTGDPLARALRNRFKREGNFPQKKFICVFSDERVPHAGTAADDEPLLFGKRQANGSLVHITAVFGMTLAGLVVQTIVSSGSTTSPSFK